MSLTLTPSCPTGSATGSGNSSCSKMTLPSTVSSTPVGIGGTHSISNSHCSISSQCGAGALAPIMEIREMTGYCNLPDKYWTHHHPGPTSVVAGSNARHSSVYPPVFYTPPPPPPPPPPSNYSSSTAVQASGVSSGMPPSSDWSCPPPPPNPHADSYPHFLYSQYPSQHDYSNFLSIPTSCYETDIIMMGAGPPPPPPSLHASASGGTYDATHPSSHQSISNSFMYLPPPPPLTSFEGILSSSTTTPTPTIPPEKAVSEKTMLPSQVPSPLSSTTDSSSSDLEEDDRHVISIEDDENENDNTSVESEISSPDLPRCVLCKKAAAPLLMPPTASSPQLSKILENIDDSELDISVCSGDIEIGGIEDEMIQQVTEQHQLNSCRITLKRLAQIVGVPVSQLALSPDHDPKSDENEFAVLCTKCLKIVGMAESLDKQLTSVLDSLRQTLNTPMPEVQKPPLSVSTQTDINDLVHEDESRHYPEGKLYRTITIYLNSNTKEPAPTPIEAIRHASTPENSSPVTKENLSDSFLCHFCGSNFTCGRNLGKHIKRHHNADPSLLYRISCDRTNCGQTCPDSSALQIHMRSHTGDKPHFCANCLKLFSTKSNLTAHTKSQTCQPKSPPTPLEFSLVPPSDTRIDVDPQPKLPELNEDETGSNGKLECKNCGLRFRTTAKLQKHAIMTTCSRSKLFECKVCGQIFAKRSELRVHEVVHTGVKSFPCDICGMTFTTRGNQKVHTRTHFTEKRFKCQHCTKEFTRKLTLQQHIIKIHNKMTED